MSVNHTLSDLLIRIKNGYNAKHLEVIGIKSNFILAVLDVLFKEGYINGYKIVKKKNISYVCVLLKYHQKNDVIKKIDYVAKPSEKVYVSVKELRQIHKKKKFKGLIHPFGLLILSTSKGVLSYKDALKHNIGGQIIASIY